MGINIFEIDTILMLVYRNSIPLLKVGGPPRAYEFLRVSSNVKIFIC